MPWQWSRNIIKVLWSTFQQYYAPFTVLLDDGFSEQGLLRHLSNNVFGAHNFGNTKSMRVIFFSKCSKFNVDFKNAEKKPEIFFCFWYNWIWIDIVKLSLLRTWYLSLAANMLGNSRKICHKTKRHFLQLNWHQSNQ